MTAAVSNDQGGESREELLRTPDLWELFCERAIADAVRASNRREAGGPSFFGILATGLVSGFFLAFGQWIFFYVFATMTGAQLLWLLVSKADSSRNSPQKIQSGIRSGRFPADIRNSLVKRLRWWNYLIIPSEWTPNSRVFEIQKNLEARRTEIDDEIKFWRSDEGKKKVAEMEEKAKAAEQRREEQDRKLRYLQSRGVHITSLDSPEAAKEEAPTEHFDDPDKLTRKIISVEQRDAQMARILALPEREDRLKQEKVFVDAMLLKIQKIADLMENISALHPALEEVTAENLDAGVRKMVTILEQRRQLVTTINRIRPQDVLKLVGYDIGFVKKMEDLAAMG